MLAYSNKRSSGYNQPFPKNETAHVCHFSPSATEHHFGAVLQGTDHSALLKIVTDVHEIRGLSYWLSSVRPAERLLLTESQNT